MQAKNDKYHVDVESRKSKVESQKSKVKSRKVKAFLID